MALRSRTIESEDVLLDEARRMRRGPRTDPELITPSRRTSNRWTPSPPACRSRTAQVRPP
jgi:hypothetical protein